ncbi:MAG: hypothetical protein A4E50_01580 [Methanosaeta sp. PtaB.Bin087]|nr:MAG: hypothetical protein A4E50_01580 [Methanosaeta sp. PtaB.Bin087]
MTIVGATRATKASRLYEAGVYHSGEPMGTRRIDPRTMQASPAAPIRPKPGLFSSTRRRTSPRIIRNRAPRLTEKPRPMRPRARVITPTSSAPRPGFERPKMRA